MPRKADGTLLFDTKIDTDGFNKDASGLANAIKRVYQKASKVMRGFIAQMIRSLRTVHRKITEALNTKKISRNFNAFFKVVIKDALYIVKLLAAAAAAFAVVGLVVMAAIRIVKDLVVKAWKAAEDFTGQLYQALSHASAMWPLVENLERGFERIHGSVMALGATILNVVGPALLKIIDVIVYIINTVAMFIASWAGLDTVMQFVSGAADKAADAIGGAAGQQERLNEAAEGALAAWDELNVLNQAQEPTGGGGPGGGPIEMQPVAVDPDFWKDTLEKMVKFWNEVVVPALQDSWQKFLDKIKLWFAQKMLEIIDWWLTTGQFKVGEAFLAVFTFVGKAIAAVFMFIVRGFVAFVELIGIILLGLGLLIAGAFKLALYLVLSTVKFIWNGIKAFGLLIATWAVATYLSFLKMWWKIKEVWAKVKPWFKENVTDPMKELFKAMVNGIIGFLNKMISAIVTGINAIIRGINRLQIDVPRVPGITEGFTLGFNLAELTAPKIPLLATGAVIPPNQPFAAILGDQRAGRNIEAPEELIRDIIRDEMGQIQGNFKFEFGGSMGELVRALKPYIEKEDVRVGASLIERSVG